MSSTADLTQLSKEEHAQKLYEVWEGEIASPIRQGKGVEQNVISNFEKNLTTFMSRVGVEGLPSGR